MTKISIAMITMLGLTALAFAGDPKADPKAGAPKADAKDAKMAPVAPVVPPKAMEMPKPAQEVADMAKAKSGTWNCFGTASMGTEMKFKGMMKSKVDLAGFWVHDSFAGTMGEGKTSMAFAFEAYSTFDSSSKKWRAIFVDNMGGQMIGTSDGMKDGKMDTMSDTMDARGKGQFKDHADMTDLKQGVHMWGEDSHDGGKTWNKVYDMTCKK